MDILIAKSVQFGIVAFVLFQLFTKRYDLLDAIAFLIPYKAIVYDVGIAVYIYQAFIFITFVKVMVFIKWDKIRINGYLLLFLTYIVLSTFIISHFFIDDWMVNLHHNSFFRQKGRYISTLLLLIFFQYSILIIYFNSVFYQEKINKLLKVFISGLLCLSILAVIQLIIFLGTGLDIFPMGMNNSDGRVRTAVHNMLSDNIGILRVNALGGEPKGLAASLSVGVSVLFLASKFEIQIIKRQKQIMWLFLLVIFLTLSTGGYGLMVGFFLIVFILNILKNRIKLRRVKWQQATIFFTIIAIIAINFNVIYNIIDKRILSRAEELSGEESDGIIQDFLIANPRWGVFGSGSGNIHNLAHPYMPEELKYYMKGNIFVARGGYLKLISENGIVGLLLLFLFLGSIIFRLNKLYDQNRYYKFFLYLILTNLAFFLVRGGYVEYHFLFLLSLGMVYLHIQKYGPLKKTSVSRTVYTNNSKSK